SIRPPRVRLLSTMQEGKSVRLLPPSRHPSIRNKEKGEATLCPLAQLLLRRFVSLCPSTLSRRPELSKGRRMQILPSPPHPYRLRAKTTRKSAAQPCGVVSLPPPYRRCGRPTSSAVFFPLWLSVVILQQPIRRKFLSRPHSPRTRHRPLAM